MRGIDEDSQLAMAIALSLRESMQQQRQQEGGSS